MIRVPHAVNAQLNVTQYGTGVPSDDATLVSSKLAMCVTVIT